MELLVQFMAKPAPAKEDVQWYLVTDNMPMQGFEDVNNMGKLIVMEMKVIDSETHVFETTIAISNLTENITLRITIRNMAGTTEKIFFLMYPSPTTPSMVPTMEQVHVTTASTSTIDITRVSVVFLLALILFTIFMILTTILVVRHRRCGQELKERDTTGRGRF